MSRSVIPPLLAIVLITAAMFGCVEGWDGAAALVPPAAAVCGWVGWVEGRRQ